MTGERFSDSSHLDAEMGFKCGFSIAPWALAALIGLSGCAKDNVTGPTPLYEGVWRGETSQDSTLGFVVSGDKITKFWMSITVTASLGDTTCASKIECLEGDYCSDFSSTPAQIAGDGSFSLSASTSSFSGRFHSSGSVSGEAAFSLEFSDPCAGQTGSATVTWTAYKFKSTLVTTTQINSGGFDLVGSWEVQYSDFENCASCKNRSAGWELLADATMCSTGPGGYERAACGKSTATNGIWNADGAAFAAQLGNGYATYTGIIDGATMHGTAVNLDGASWSWSAVKKQ